MWILVMKLICIHVCDLWLYCGHESISAWWDVLVWNWVILCNFDVVLICGIGQVDIKCYIV